MSNASMSHHRQHLHQLVERLEKSLTQLARLMTDCSSLAVAIHQLDFHISLPESEDVDISMHERVAVWRKTINNLKVNLEKAASLWNQEISGPDTALRFDFGRSSRRRVNCGPLEDITYHGLVIKLAAVAIDPDAVRTSGTEVDPCAVPDDIAETLRLEIGWICDDTEADNRKIIRKDTLEAWTDIELRKQIRFGLEAEYPRVLDRPPLAEAPVRAPVKKGESTHSRPADVPDGYRLLKELYEEHGVRRSTAYDHASKNSFKSLMDGENRRWALEDEFIAWAKKRARK